jgi:hypothetical protein
MIELPLILKYGVPGSNTRWIAVQVLSLVRNQQHLRTDMVHMETSVPFTIRILKISKSHTSMSLKIMALNTLIDIYIKSVCKKVSLKICCIMEDIKKSNF